MHSITYSYEKKYNRSYGMSLKPIIFTYMGFGERIQKLRNDLGLSREALAGRVDLSARTIENYEANLRDPKVGDLIKIAKALNTTVAYLAGEVTDPSPEALKNIPEITEEDAAALGFRARGKDWDDLLPTDEMQLALQELAAIRRIRLLKEAERKKGSADTSGGSSES